MKYFLAIDLGATSGRHIMGYKENGNIVLEEVHRFATLMSDSPDGLIWDLDRIFLEIKKGIKLAFSKYPVIESMSIDTWGVDYVLMNNDKEIKPYYAYRNDRCNISAENVQKSIPFSEIYAHTGIQYAPFNTIYQLADDLSKGRLQEATDYLMLPSYFSYKLTGVKTHEYTNESTTSLLNPATCDYDYSLIDRLGLPKKLFGKISKPGDEVGYLLPSIQKEVGGNTKVVLCASHDTASAFEAVDVDKDTVIISSGTWSLLGVKADKPIINDIAMNANYTNEGGVGYIRFLKNIMGMYLLNKVKDELGIDFEYINSNIIHSKYNKTFDVNDASLNYPVSMKGAICKLLASDAPNSDIDLISSIYHSLALCYRDAINELESISGKSFSKVVIVGGGAKSDFLNNLVKEYTNKEVIAMPIEATALGNIKLQMKESEKNEKRS